MNRRRTFQSNAWRLHLAAALGACVGALAIATLVVGLQVIA